MQVSPEAGKLIVCGYREGDVPQFGFKSDFFKELDIPLKYNVRMIMGTDEESGSEDIAYYYSKNPYAPFAFSPDGARRQFFLL